MSPGLDEVGSGAQALVGYEIDLTPGDGSAHIILDIEPKHLNRNQTLHGGIISMMLDAAAGFAASRSSAKVGFTPVFTVSLTTHYLAPARSGRVVTTGKFVGGGYKILYADAVMRDASGHALATGCGVFKRDLKGSK
ncbi:MAG: PaaI family thioesterase [Pseudomonadota bacterium]